MCGIVGYAGARRPGAAALADMADAVAHRGPDGHGVKVFQGAGSLFEVGLGHRRLAIVDLRHGAQPMSGAGDAVHLTFNGEIYNYRELRAELQTRGHSFSTASDTEVLLRAYEEWGAQCTHRLRGMFAFAIWDARQQSLLLARDRYGEKPLYFVEIDGALVFASEQGALMRWPGFEARLNVDVLAQYLQFRYVPGPATWLQQVRKLAPGCTLTWTSKGWTEQRYFQPPDARALRTAPTSKPEAAERLRQILTDTVKLLMHADVPHGAFLSGGIDSSALIALMTLAGDPVVRTFSVGFAEERYSELGHARLVAQAFGTEHHELVISAQDMIEALPDAAFYRDAPISEPADVPMFLLAREARGHVKVVLSGEGSDEAFAGYPKHAFEPYAAHYQTMPRALRNRVVEPLMSRLPLGGGRVKTAMDSMALESFEDRMPRWFGALSPHEVQGLCGQMPQPLVNGAAYPFATEPGLSALRRILYFDQTSWLPDNLLERGDRMTMASGLEARMPFMDQEVMAFASSLPDGWRMNGTQGKHLLKQAMGPLLPESVIARRKVGFSMPIQVWLRTAMRDMVGDLLLGPSSAVGSLINRERLGRYIDEHQSGRINREKLLWMLLNLELWIRSRGVRV